MAFENFFRRDRGRESGTRDRADWRSEDERLGRRGSESARSFGADDERDFDRRGWREGSDYYGHRDERYAAGNYGLGDRSAATRHGERGYGGQDYGASEWRDEGMSYGGEFSAGSYTQGDFGGDSDDRTIRGSFGAGGYGRDLDYGRRGALGHGGYGGMGGAETGSSAYNYGMHERYRGRGPRGYRRSDERIREDVCEMLTDDPYIDASDMEVHVKDCEVTLTGTVSSREEKRRAEDLAERISGVKDVHNTLRVMREPREEDRQGASARGTQASQTGQVARH